MAGFDFLKDGQASGALSKRFNDLFTLAKDNDDPVLSPITLDPGDFAFTGGDSESFSLSLPIAYDVWYLWNTVNIIDEDKLETFWEIILSPLFQNHDTPQILRTILKNSVAANVEPTRHLFEQSGVYCIKEMRFETLLKDKSPKWPSDGPDYAMNSEIDHAGKGIGDLYSGYLAFPVGPLGVMMTVSIISESILSDETYQVSNNSLDVIEGKDLITPIVEQNNDCMGRHIIENAYVLNDRDAEYPANKMAGEEAILPHHWLRLWLKAEATWPIPGEFISLICKPLGMPPHCWWYQETSPFIYSGNFFETEYYSSGYIMAILEVVATNMDTHLSTLRVTSLSSTYTQQVGTDNKVLTINEEFTDREEVSSVYKVRIKDQDIFMLPSDFLTYEIDQQVTIRKIPGRVEENFNWKDLVPGKTICESGVEGQQAYASTRANTSFELNTDWAIVPITFYINKE